MLNATHRHSAQCHLSAWQGAIFLPFSSPLFLSALGRDWHLSDCGHYQVSDSSLNESFPCFIRLPSLEFTLRIIYMSDKKCDFAHLCNFEFEFEF
jgi:hypothetical protein